jgi:long-chain acyl-CoA synthetase
MLAQLLVDTASRYGKRTALVYGDDCWTWDELVDEVLSLTGGLARVGIQPNDHVALWLANSPCFILSYFAILSRGAIVVTLNPDMRQGDFSLLRGRVDAVITSRQFEAVCKRAITFTDGNADTQVLVCPDPARPVDWNLAQSDPVPVAIRHAGDPAMLQYSSGSTGNPKPLYRTHGQCMAEVHHFQATCGIHEGDVFFCALPLFHAHGMANALWAAVRSGAKLVLMKNPQPFSLQCQRALALLHSERVTVYPGVPLMFQILAEAPATADLSSVRLCFSAGGALPKAVFARFSAKFGVPVRQLYGCTEAGSVSINLDADAQEGCETVGRPMVGVKIEIRSETGQALPPGDAGDVVIHSPALANGYLDGSQNSPFLPGGWFMTGDMGRLDEKSRLQIVGRKSFVISVAGHKVFANEVEEVLTAHHHIAEAAVIAMPDERTEQAIKAFVVLSEPLNECEFFDYCRAQLPVFKRPKKVVFVEALPKTSLGKVAKSQLV